MRFLYSRMNLVKAVKTTVKFEIAIPSLVPQPKNIMMRGMTTPPPAVPAAFEMKAMIIIRKQPMNSIMFIGNNGLCLQIPS